MSQKPAVLAALKKAHNVIAISDALGVPRPQAYTDAYAMLQAARAAERDIVACPAPPSKPAAIAKYVKDVAQARILEEARRNVVAELVLDWERQTALAGLAATQAANTALVQHFDKTVAAFDTLADAPRVLSGHETGLRLTSR